MKYKEVESRFKRGYVMSIYGNYPNMVEQMREDVKILLAAINNTLCCTELKDKEVIDYKQFIVNPTDIEMDSYDIWINGVALSDDETLIDVYN